jgi:hypothetical protein
MLIVMIVCTYVLFSSPVDKRYDIVASVAFVQTIVLVVSFLLVIILIILFGSAANEAFSKHR